MTQEQEQKLADWTVAKTRLQDLQKLENTLRKELVAELFADRTEGTETLALAHGYKLKATKKVNYYVGNDQLTRLEVMLNKLKGEALFTSLFRFKPELSVTQYKQALPVFLETLAPAAAARVRQQLAETITIAPAMPTLELIEPDGNK